jgi:hypothetical protein
MKRYDLESTGWDHEEMVERPLGDWCEWDEVDTERAKDREEIARLREVLEKKDIQYRVKVTRLKEGLRAVELLINESSGVDGLHMNGDTATWDELRKGGRYEEWLRDFDEALEGKYAQKD